MILFGQKLDIIYIYPAIVFMIAMIVSSYSIPVIITITKEKNLVDIPDGDRKLHKKIIPTLGGIAIYAAVIISFSLFSELHFTKSLTYVIGSLTILFFIGLKDDILVISPLKKLIGQLCAVTVVIISGLHISNLGGVFGIYALPLWIGVPLTFFVFVVIINAYNLIDGVDGLAGSIGVIVSAVFGVFFLLNGRYALAILAFSLMGALFGFLLHNFSPASIFMGDTGSMIVGFLIAFLTVKFVELNVTHSVQSYLSHEAPILVVAVLIVPLYDTLRVFIIRMLDGRSPFSPGFEHVHHQFIKMGLSHRSIALTLGAINIGFIVSFLFFPNSNVNILLVCLIIASLLVFPTIGLKRKIISKLFHFDSKKTEPKAIKKQSEIILGKQEVDSKDINGKKKLEEKRILEKVI